MSKVNIFVSSTCYDLSQIRTDLKEFIRDLGHNPVLSEEHDFPIDPNLSNAENCINAVKNEADVFVLIIGNRYGCKLDTGKSITNTEFLTALEKGIPIYTFTLKEMLNILPVWEKNPDGDFSGTVDDTGIFKFIEDVRKNSGLWNFPFEKAQDIKTILRAQLSNLFNDSLQIRKRVLRLGHNDLYSKISAQALKILLDKEEYYEIKFFFQCMRDEFLKYKDLRRDYDYSIIIKSSQKLTSYQEYKNWSLFKLGQFQNITASLNRLVNKAYPYFYAEPDESSDPDGLYYVACTFGKSYAALLEWSIEVKSLITPEPYKESLDIFSEIPACAISQIESFPSDCLKKIEETIKLYSKDSREIITISLDLELSIDDQLVEKHSIALDKLEELVVSGEVDF